MEDLTIDLNDGRLNCRAAAIIVHNGKVLFHKNTADTYYALVGGRIQINESSDDAVKRELKEELGKDVELTGYIATVENFFELNRKKYHEMLFIHRAEFVSEEDKKIIHTLQNVEGVKETEGKHIQYEWLDIEKIDTYNIKPAIIKSVLKEWNFPRHVINKEA